MTMTSSHGYKKVLRMAFRICPAIILAGMAAAAIFFVRADISGTSMAPTLNDGDVCVAVRPWAAGGPKRGDIVLARDPGRDRILVKRVAAVGGDHVEIDDHGSLSVNGEAIREPYADIPDAPGQTCAWDVPDGFLFVLGDNRGGSMDSRDPRVGPIPEGSVIGIVWFRMLPCRSAGAVP